MSFGNSWLSAVLGRIYGLPCLRKTIWSSNLKMNISTIQNINLQNTELHFYIKNLMTKRDCKNIRLLMTYTGIEGQLKIC